MTSENFYNEIKNSDLCPDDFDAICKNYSEHMVLLRTTLNEFHRVCELKGIHYQLIAGSLLGAIRDDGQIPWDCDSDVVVPYEEKDKLIQVLNEELSDQFYCYCPETNNNCRHFFMRITPKGYRSDLLHVDVFYLIGVPEDMDDRKKVYSRLDHLLNIRYYKLVKISEYPRYRWKKKCKALLKKMQYAFIPISRIEKQFDSLCKTNPYYGSKVCTLTENAVKGIYIETELLQETILHDTPKGTYRIPKQYDAVLKGFYKDYNRIYPLKNRFDEMMNSYYKFTEQDQHQETWGRYYLKNNE